ncbi:MAG TPA: DHA2 family efflux MFS transporter permease subunit [Acidimicrobiales bacterium]|nr:DHA2 family efflux MFS transporter permease subunit [Acidimicrobiales bacterium]
MHDVHAPEHPIDPQVYARRHAILGVLCLSLMIVIIGNTALNVAIPTLARELDASTTDLQWMVDAYALVFAGMLFTAGTLGDRFGRKGALQGGLVLFAIGTLIAAFATTSTMVIAARAVMGLAAAFVMPSTLSLLTNVFPPAERPKAIAVWAGISGGGAALGPIASGFLLEHFWWGSVFLVNVPVLLLALVAGKVLVPTSRDPEQPPLDVPGALLSIAGLSALVYAIIEGPVRGWASTETIGTFAGAGLLLVLFAIRELRAEHPMLDLRYFRDARFSAASGGITMIFFAMFGTFFLVSQYFQLVLGFSPLEAGLLQLPMGFVMMLVSPQVPGLVARFGPRNVVPIGLGIVAFGLLAFSFVGVGTPAWLVLVPAVFLAVGMALSMTPLTTLIMASVPVTKAGVGSAMNDTTRELGGALGVAVLGSVLTSTYSSSLRPAVEGLPAPARAVAETGLTGAMAVAAEMGEAGTALVDAAKQAFVDGLGLAAIIGGIIVALVALGVRRALPVHVAGPITAARPRELGVEPDATQAVAGGDTGIGEIDLGDLSGADATS